MTMRQGKVSKFFPIKEKKKNQKKKKKNRRNGKLQPEVINPVNEKFPVPHDAPTNEHSKYTEQKKNSKSLSSSAPQNWS